MKNFINLACVMLLLTAMNSDAQSCPIPEPLDMSQAVGKYEGIYLKDGKSLPLTIAIKLKDDLLNTEITMNNKSMKKVETELCVQENLHITVSDSGMTYEFRGKPENGKMTGRLIYKDSKDKTSTELFSVTKK